MAFYIPEWHIPIPAFMCKNFTKMYKTDVLADFYMHEKIILTNIAKIKHNANKRQFTVKILKIVAL